MYNKPIIITGCQRSGTTLLNLVLDSHPDITAIDELEFDGSRVREYLESPDFHPRVAFKLPAEATSFRSFAHLPELKVLWSMRDPRDVVLSMLNLTMRFVDGVPVSWPNSSPGGEMELDVCLQMVDTSNLTAAVQEYQRSREVPPHLRTRAQGVLRAALVWELKNALLDLYSAENISYKIVLYERLVTDPKAEIAEVLDFLGLPWHEDVLRHHELHSGVYAGHTRGDKPIDPSNAGKWKGELSAEDLELIWAICGERAEKFGYHM